MSARAAAQPWDDIITGLTGLRLALYDELLRHGAMPENVLARYLNSQHSPPESYALLAAAVGWLAERRLLVAHEGEWRAVGLGLARMNYESNGPATATAPSAAEGPRAKDQGPRAAERTPVERGATAAVQRHQREFFTMEGYKDSNGSL